MMMVVVVVVIRVQRIALGLNFYVLYYTNFSGHPSHHQGGQNKRENVNGTETYTLNSASFAYPV
jgi:hypothetical protein